MDAHTRLAVSESTSEMDRWNCDLAHALARPRRSLWVLRDLAAGAARAKLGFEHRAEVGEDLVLAVRLRATAARRTLRVLMTR